MVHHHSIKEPLVAVLQRDQIDVLFDGGCFATKVLQDLLDLLVLRQNLWGQEPAEVEPVPFVFRESRSFIEARVVEKIDSLVVGWRSIAIAPPMGFRTE
jgi:hypothetical protein